MPNLEDSGVEANSSRVVTLSGSDEQLASFLRWKSVLGKYVPRKLSSTLADPRTNNPPGDVFSGLLALRPRTVGKSL